VDATEGNSFIFWRPTVSLCGRCSEQCQSDHLPLAEFRLPTRVCSLRCSHSGPPARTHPLAAVEALLCLNPAEWRIDCSAIDSTHSRPRIWVKMSASHHCSIVAIQHFRAVYQFKARAKWSVIGELITGIRIWCLNFINTEVQLQKCWFDKIHKYVSEVAQHRITITSGCGDSATTIPTLNRTQHRAQGGHRILLCKMRFSLHERKFQEGFHNRYRNYTTLPQGITCLEA